MVLVTNIFSSGDALILSRACPEKMPWVQAAKTFLAPFFFRALMVAHRVPAVSMMSSTMMAFLFSTSPMMCISSATLGAVRFLSAMARSAFSLRANSRALSTPPASGETMTRSFNFIFLKWEMKTGRAMRLSTGMLKKPWIWAA